MGALSVLVADDEEQIRGLIAGWLRAEGCEVTCVSGGREGAERARAGRFDLVVTDVRMADGDGLEFMADLRKMRARSRVLAISGGGPSFAGASYLDFAASVGADALLIKPFTPRQFLEAVRLICGKRWGGATRKTAPRSRGRKIRWLRGPRPTA